MKSSVCALHAKEMWKHKTFTVVSQTCTLVYTSKSERKPNEWDERRREREKNEHTKSTFDAFYVSHQQQKTRVYVNTRWLCSPEYSTQHIVWYINKQVVVYGFFAFDKKPVLRWLDFFSLHFSLLSCSNERRTELQKKTQQPAKAIKKRNWQEQENEDGITFTRFTMIIINNRAEWMLWMFDIHAAPLDVDWRNFHRWIDLKDKIQIQIL